MCIFHSGDTWGLSERSWEVQHTEETGINAHRVERIAKILGEFSSWLSLVKVYTHFSTANSLKDPLATMNRIAESSCKVTIITVMKNLQVCTGRPVKFPSLFSHYLPGFQHLAQVSEIISYWIEKNIISSHLFTLISKSHNFFSWRKIKLLCDLSQLIHSFQQFTGEKAEFWMSDSTV